MTVVEKPARAGPMAVQLQLQELNAAIEKRDWMAVGGIAAKTTLLEVGKRALDALVVQGGEESSDYADAVVCTRQKDIAEYGVAAAAKAKNWSALACIYTLRDELCESSLGETALGHIKRATESDVDAAAKNKNWDDVAAIGENGKDKVAIYAADVAMKAGDKGCVECIGVDGSDTVALHVIGLIAKAEDWKVRERWGALDNIFESRGRTRKKD